MAVSINERSPFLDKEDGENKVAAVVRHLCLRSIANGEEYPATVSLCDAIARLNYQAFENHGLHRAQTEATKLGDRFEDMFNKSIEALGVGANKRVQVCRFGDDHNHGWINDEFLELLKKDESLDRRVEVIAKEFLEHRGQGRLGASAKNKRRLALCKEYIFREIPTFLTGIVINSNIHYKLLYYGGNHAHMSVFATDHDSLYKLIDEMHKDAQFRGIVQKIVQRSHAKSLSVPGFVSIRFPN
ncbi:expressed unknown protein [Seminavis robusta]|uniref:Uncharacterized protein n=1 Tax=Seminavis robusta TaxID=568900 RepID=A0A9N8H466_9STRA|nr:expressed unknown protein [Seminavis robusta]|eukprot:Sro105_g053400.1 n/a (243) ;mRNA; r:117330-118141